MPQTADERLVYIINQLLMSEQPINVYDLSEELYVSISTLKTDLNRAKRRVAKARLTLIFKQNMVYLKGLEKDKRKLARELLYDEASVSFFDLATVQRAFPHIDTAFINTCVRETLDEFQYYANDYSIANLVLHIAVTIDRIRTHHGIVGDTLDEEAFACLSSRDNLLAKAVSKRLGHHFHLEFSPCEVYELSLLIASRTTMLDYRTATKETIEHFVGAECLELVNEIIADLARYFGIDLSEPEFFVRFALHIKNLLLRAQSGGLSNNPLTNQIKSSCPLLYDTAVAEAGLIKERTGLDINDDEIAYIAFHLGSTLETQKQLTNKVKAILYCPSYYDIDKRVTLFLDQRFEADLLVTNVVTDESNLAHLAGAELLISTVPVNSIPNMPEYRISVFPSEHDAAALRRLIDHIQRDKRRAALRRNLESLITSELFEVNDSLTERDEVIAHMARRMNELGYTQPEYEDQVRERERLSSTAFTNFAIPHPVRLCSERSGISVLVSPTPVLWGETRVSLVVMLAFCRSDRALFYEVFDPLVSVLSNPEQVRDLSRIHNYEDFITKLSELID